MSNDNRFHLVMPPVIDTGRWIPLANEESYLLGYFEFLERARLINLPVTDTNLKRLRLFALAAWCRAICERGEPHHIAECGGFVGHSTYTIASILDEFGFRNTFHVFDSWEGLSDFSAQDLIAISNNVEPETLQQMAPQFSRSGRRPFSASLNLFEMMLSPFRFVTPYKGWIPTRFNEVADLKFSLIHIDVDIFQPTKDALEFFYPRLCSGGVICIDDYAMNTWPGCNVAVDQFVENHCSSDLVFKTPFGGLAIVKK